MPGNWRNVWAELLTGLFWPPPSPFPSPCLPLCQRISHAPFPYALLADLWPREKSISTPLAFIWQKTKEGAVGMENSCGIQANQQLLPEVHAGVLRRSITPPHSSILSCWENPPSIPLVKLKVVNFGYCCQELVTSRGKILQKCTLQKINCSTIRYFKWENFDE